MTPTEPRYSASASTKPLVLTQPSLPATESQDPTRWANLFARAAGAEGAARELAYGCVDWYLYGGEDLSHVGH